MAHEYTVVTPHGDVHLTTQHHHSMFSSIHDFLEAHKTEIQDAIAIGGLLVGSCNLYMSHFRRGPRLQ